MNKLILILGLLMCSLVVLEAQNNQEEITIPLSDPNGSGILDVSLRRGGVEVTGYNGKVVVITLISKEGEDNHNNDRPGLKRITNHAMNVSIEEESNRVDIRGGNHGHTDILVKVPMNFDLQISTHHDGDVVVNGVSGELEVNCHHGGMVLNDISGSLIAGTHHGGILATFNSIDDSKPMAFTTHHGDVDISFPASSDFDAKIKSARGDIFTDFDLDMSVKVSKENKGEKIKMKSWMYGTAGSGGKEYMFSTYHGDVIIRQSK